MLVFCFILFLFAKSDSPGAEMCIPISTFNSVSKEGVSYFLKQFSSLALPTIEEELDSPVGKVEFTLSSLQFTSLTVGSTIFSIATPQTMTLTISSAAASLTGDWKYKEKHGLHISDHGSLDLSVNCDVSITFGAKIDPTQKSGVQILITACTLSFNSFDLRLHGGASWLYNFIIDNLRGKIEKSIESSVESQVQSSVLPIVQKDVDAYTTLPIGFDDIEISVVIKTFQFDSTNDFLLLGVEGLFFKENTKRYPGTPVPLPTSFSSSSLEMVNAEFTQFTVNSLFWTLGETQFFKYIVTQEMIPSSFPFQLNTSSFKYIIPNLYNVYPNEKMQITIITNPSNPPISQFTTDSGIIAKGDVYLYFQVFNNSTTTPIDAFVIDVQMAVNGSVSIYTNTTTKKEMITSTVDLYGTIDMSLIQTNIGNFTLALFELILQPAIKTFILPLMNQYLKDHPFEIPSFSGNQFSFKNIKYKLFDGFVQANTDFVLNLGS